MERDQEKMQFLGFFGIYKESYKIMLSWKKIFSLITLTLILPLSLIFLIHLQVSQFFFRDILIYSERISKSQFIAPQHKRPIETISIGWATFILFKLVYFVFVIAFALLSTSTVVSTIASVYASREVTFKKAMSVVTKVWKRLILTFLCTFLVFFIYNILVGFVILTWAVTISQKVYGIGILMVIGILCFVGFLYLAAVLQLANVVTMLEESRGFKAMKKSNELIKGKKGLSMIITFILSVSFFLIQFLFSIVVVNNWKMFHVSFMWRIATGILCLLLLAHLFLLMLVIQTVLYFVCKSYHHQVIDNSTLLERLEGLYQGDHELLQKTTEVQIESNV